MGNSTVNLNRQIASAPPRKWHFVQLFMESRHFLISVSSPPPSQVIAKAGEKRGSRTALSKISTLSRNETINLKQKCWQHLPWVTSVRAKYNTFLIFLLFNNIKYEIILS